MRGCFVGCSGTCPAQQQHQGHGSDRGEAGPSSCLPAWPPASPSARQWRSLAALRRGVEPVAACQPGARPRPSSLPALWVFQEVAARMVQQADTDGDGQVRRAACSRGLGGNQGSTPTQQGAARARPCCAAAVPLLGQPTPPTHAPRALRSAWPSCWRCRWANLRRAAPRCCARCSASWT